MNTALEIIPASESTDSVRDEAHRRAAKAGYCTRYGECRAATKIQNTVNWGRQKLNVWPRDNNGNLIE